MGFEPVRRIVMYIQSSGVRDAAAVDGTQITAWRRRLNRNLGV